MDSLEFARFIVNLVEDKKAENIVLLDLRPDALIADFFIICTGLSDRQLNALQENVREAVKSEIGKIPVAREGTAESGWILMDYGDVVLHIFTVQQRAFYDLESFWSQQADASVLLNIQ